MAGFPPAIHAFLPGLEVRRGCPRHQRAWRL